MPFRRCLTSLGLFASTLISAAALGQSNYFGSPVVDTVGNTDNPANQYPTTALVTNGPPVASISVTIPFSSSDPSRYGFLLVPPHGNPVLLDGGCLTNTAVNFINYKFKDGGASPNNAAVSGTYAPGNCSFGDFLAPAPAGPYSTSLNSLLGTDPNGTWSLYVMGKAGATSASISLSNWFITFNEDYAPQPAPSGFVYQGQLSLNGSPINGTADVRFTLWNHPTSDVVSLNQIGNPITFTNLTLKNGLVNQTVDFGAPATFGGKWLDIAVRSPAGSGSYVTIGRQPIGLVPQAAVAQTLAGSLGVPAMITDNAGNVAIGAAQAGAAQLYIHKDNGLASMRIDSSNGSPAIAFATNVRAWYLGVDQGDASKFKIGFNNTIPDTTPALVIDPSTGNVGVGTDAPTGLFTVNGTALKPGGGAWGAFCDPRLKQDIHPLDNALDKLLALHGYTFSYTPAAIKSQMGLAGTQIGLMADEVQKVFPQWVSTERGGYLAVSERGTTALTVEALRQLRAEKDAQIAELKKDNDELKARLARIERVLSEKPAQK